MRLAEGLVERRVDFVVALVVLLLDQLTKILAHAYLRGREPLVVINNLFHLDYSRNPGGLFGYFRDLGDPWRLLLLTLLPAIAVVLVAMFLATSDELDRRTRLGLGLILGGAVGNLIDRAFRGEVVDFLDVFVASPGLAGWLVQRFGTAHWPTFNIADSGIVVGASLMMLSAIRPQPVRSAEPEQSR